MAFTIVLRERDARGDIIREREVPIEQLFEMMHTGEERLPTAARPSAFALPLEDSTLDEVDASHPR